MRVKKKSILVVSSDRELSHALGENLSHRDYIVTGTLDCGENLKKIISKLSPDLIIICMPVSCVEAVELCLQVRKWHHNPIILVHNWGIGVKPVFDAESYSIGWSYNIKALMQKIETTFSNN